MKTSKSILAVAIALMMVSAPVFAKSNDGSKQQIDFPKNEVSVGYGFMSYMPILSVLESMSTMGVAALLGTNIDLTGVYSTGSISAEYMHHFGNHFALGGALSYESLSTTYLQEGSTEAMESRVSVISILPSVKFPWFHKPHVDMYSKIALGCSIMSDKGEEGGSSAMFAGQLSPICIDFGGNAFRGFVETGFGIQGIFAGGVRYRF